MPSAFLEYGTPLLPLMAQELDGRDIVAHQGLMAPDGYVGAHELERIALVQTMLVALLGRVAGYAGAINGWLLDKMGYPVEPTIEWWAIAPRDRSAASVTYVAEGAPSAEQ